jgi:hypothetical protein
LLKISYKSWFDSLSDIPEIENACLEVCNNIYQRGYDNNNWNIQTIKVGELTKTFFANWQNNFDFDYLTVLNNYKILKPL